MTGEDNDRMAMGLRANDTDHRPGGNRVRFGTESLSPGSVHPFCVRLTWA
jgi:hypothetical protein